MGVETRRLGFRRCQRIRGDHSPPVELFVLCLRCQIGWRYSKMACSTTDPKFLLLASLPRESESLESRAVSVNLNRISNKLKANIVEFSKTGCSILVTRAGDTRKTKSGPILSPRHGNNSQLLEERQILDQIPVLRDQTALKINLKELAIIQLK